MFLRNFLSCALRSCVLCLFALGSLLHAAPPSWWYSGNPPVLDVSAPSENKGVANIGQAKWMAKNALAALREVLPDVADAVEADLVGTGKPIANWDAPLSQAEKDAQHVPLLIGQLKAISAPFYLHLKAAAPQWLYSEMAFYNMPAGDFPWTAATTDDSNTAMASIGQLKAVFSLDFSADRETGEDADGIPDLWEWAAVNANATDGWTGIGQINPTNGGTVGTGTGTGTPPTTPPVLRDRDGDGIDNDTEVVNGTNPDKWDTDEDKISDAEDADPLDRAVCWLRCPESRYAVVELKQPPENAIPIDLSETGHVLARRVTMTSGWGYPYGWPGFTPSKQNGATYVLKPTASDWTGPLKQKDSTLGLGTGITTSGLVVGQGSQAVAREADGLEPMGWPGQVFINGAWKPDDQGDYPDFFILDPNTHPGVHFSIAGFKSGEDGGSATLIPPLYPRVAGDRVIYCSYGMDTSSSHFTWTLRDEANELLTREGSSFFDADGFALECSGSGWAAAGYYGNSAEKYLFPPAGGILPGPKQSLTLQGLTKIDPELVPVPAGGTKPDVVVWLDDATLHTGKRSSGGSFAWQPSTRSQEQAANRFGGKINARGEGISGSKIWRNGKWREISTLLPDIYFNLQIIDINDAGMILATADKDAIPASGNTPAQPAKLQQLIMLEPVAVRAFPAVLWNENTPHDPIDLAKGVDRMSAFALGGGGKTQEFWITAPIGNSNWPTFLTSANGTHTVEISASPHLSKTLASRSELVSISGVGTTTVDVPIVFKISGSREAANNPVQLKVMKKRTVKLALHEVMGRDASGNPTHPKFMPNPAQLKSYLDQVYSPQVNVDFEVIPFTEPGPSDPDSNEELFVDRAVDVNSAATGTKCGTGGYNIDIWVVAGVSLKVPPKSGIIYDRAFGQTLGAPGDTGRKILIDGDMKGFIEVPSGKQTHHLHFTIAHEIGHIMTSDSHPGETGYQSELFWGVSPDPHVKRRLMCSGPQIDHARPEVCLIKSEWDRIETWLHTHIDPPEPP